MPRVWPIPVTLFRHQIIITLATEFVAHFVMRSSTPRLHANQTGRQSRKERNHLSPAQLPAHNRTAIMIFSVNLKH